MTRIKALIITIMLVCGWTLTSYAKDTSRVVDGHYNVMWNNIPIGRITLTAIEDADSYFMHVKLRTSGMVRWVKKFKRKVQVEGLIEGEDSLHPHYIPQRYRYSSDYGHKKRSVEIDFVQDTVSNIMVTPPDNPDSRDIITPEDSANAKDPLTVLLRIASHVQSDVYLQEAPCTFPMLDGRRLMDMHIYHDKEIEITWDGKDMKAMRYMGSRTPIKGFSAKELERYHQGEPPLEIYINEDISRVPLRYAINTSFGRVTADWYPSGKNQ